MMPPISIDGTDITGATIDGTDVTEITVDGQTVFSAGPPIIDDFESGSLNAYNGDVNAYSITTNNTIGGQNTLVGTKQDNYIHSTAGLSNYPAAGDKFSFKVKIDGGLNVEAMFVFGVQSNQNQNYAIGLSRNPDNNNGNLTFKRDVSSGSFDFFVDNVSTTWTNDVFRFEVDWRNNGDIMVDVYNENTSTLNVSGSFNDTDYTSGGVGFHTRAPRTSPSFPQASRIAYDDCVIIG